MVNERAVLEGSEELLWDEPYHFERMRATGDVIVRERVEYIVVLCRLVGVAYIKTVLRRTHGLPR